MNLISFNPFVDVCPPEPDYFWLISRDLWASKLSPHSKTDHGGRDGETDGRTETLASVSSYRLDDAAELRKMKRKKINLRLGWGKGGWVGVVTVTVERQ